MPFSHFRLFVLPAALVAVAVFIRTGFILSSDRVAFASPKIPTDLVVKSSRKYCQGPHVFYSYTNKLDVFAKMESWNDRCVLLIASDACNGTASCSNLKPKIHLAFMGLKGIQSAFYLDNDVLLTWRARRLLTHAVMQRDGMCTTGSATIHRKATPEFFGTSHVGTAYLSFLNSWSKIIEAGVQDDAALANISMANISYRFIGIPRSSGIYHLSGRSSAKMDGMWPLRRRYALRALKPRRLFVLAVHTAIAAASKMGVRSKWSGLILAHTYLGFLYSFGKARAKTLCLRSVMDPQLTPLVKYYQAGDAYLLDDGRFLARWHPNGTCLHDYDSHWECRLLPPSVTRSELEDAYGGDTYVVDVIMIVLVLVFEMSLVFRAQKSSFILNSPHSCLAKTVL